MTTKRYRDSFESLLDTDPLVEKIIFLDIDGVLCTGNIIKKGGEFRKTLDPDCVDQLYRIVATTSCKIVLSSTWRLGGIDLVVDAIKVASLGKQNQADIICDAIIGTTPIKSSQRGLEIKEWINEHNFSGPFVIIDDNDDMLDLKSNLVKTNFDVGLVKEKADDVISMLL